MQSIFSRLSNFSADTRWCVFCSPIIFGIIHEIVDFSSNFRWIAPVTQWIRFYSSRSRSLYFTKTNCHQNIRKFAIIHTKREGLFFQIWTLFAFLQRIQPTSLRTGVFGKFHKAPMWMCQISYAESVKCYIQKKKKNHL